MAVLPTSATRIRLLSGVPFTNDYNHTRRFGSTEERDKWFADKRAVYSDTNFTFKRFDDGRKGNYVSIGKPIDQLLSVNYIAFQNEHYGSKWFYGFVTKLEFKGKTTTWVHIELDVYQTWYLDASFKPSMVVREHRPQVAPDGQPPLYTLDEGLDYGSMYETVNIEKFEPFKQLQFMVIVAKNKMHATTDDKVKVEPTMNGLPQPLSFYIHPFYYENGNVPKVNGKDSSSEQGIDRMVKALKGFYTQTDAVNNIVSLYITSYIGLAFDWDGEDLKFSTDQIQPVKLADDQHESVRTLYVKDIKKYNSKIYEMGDKYSKFGKSKESKLMMYPYRVITLTDFKGNQVDYRPEYINDVNLTLRIKGSLGTSNKISYGFDNYNNTFDGENLELMCNEHAIIDQNPNDLPIITDNLSAYLQGHRNSLANQENQAIFNGIMGALGGGVYASESVGAGNTGGTRFGNIQAVQSVGSAYYQIEGMQAKKKDIANTPPAIAKMGTNSYYDYGNGYNGIFVLYKQIKPEYQQKLEDYFHLYGYKTQRVKLPATHTRQNWNYVQTDNANITGNFNVEDLNDLKRIFNKGITLWHTDDIGNYELENGVI
ncbi:tail protein [Bacillus phage BeachBum]|uniref:Tail knob protein n=1 Tax=Bacillus phage BeachBum TaxID=1983461 RepID=A0A1X9SGF9_9CAUD|nr:tail protein [Bacillus phage BeachBum]ARQ95225.1 tail knob protein [Bacillus phage BeachBum]